MKYNKSDTFRTKFSISFLFLTALLLMFPASENLQAQTNTGLVIVNVTNARLRSEPTTDSQIIGELNIGAKLTPAEAKGSWYKIQLNAVNEDEPPLEGWISNTVVSPFDSAKPDSTLLSIARKYMERGKLTLADSKQLIPFLKQAADDAKTYEAGGELRLERLLILSRTVGAIDFEKSKTESVKPFFDQYLSEIVYYEPAGIWVVQSKQFWMLFQRYRKFKIGEQIAWQAAENPLPFECEGYVVCHLTYIRAKAGEYLNFYPNGAHTNEALKDIIASLEPIAADAETKQNYTPASDISDRADFNRILAEIRTIVSRTQYPEKLTITSQISKIAEGYR
ncbi:MAG: SH3 domain-containing protein [Pyrinomonadaceae bacterium]